MSQSLDIHKLLKSVVAYKSSDLHLVSRSEPQIRIDGRLVALNLPIMDGKQIEEMAYSLLTEKQKKAFEENNELDFSIVIPDVGRFRANYYKTMDDIACAFRIIPTTIPSLDDLNAKKIFKELIKREKGLILVTGPTGSGKSTTLAAMLNEVNLNEARHIITVEDPVEFVHQNKKSLFSHRNIGTDTKSFSAALKYALRQDPDVILIGEMRDRETISAALTAAETGHLVFGTLHTNSAPGTINRIIDVFSGEEQPQVRAQLSTSLVAVISQALLPKIGGGRIAAQEVMITNPAIANLIREDKVHQMYSQMQLNQQVTGMTTQTQEIVEFLRKKLISKDTAMQYSNKPDELQRVIDSL
ncbi:MAG: type IV pilus twitching motility protein PilT [Sulfuricurvum sp.]|uniref:type IV pilus twitching motility protein PilT n=1 Tax=Sulfuricurvum sp. TaxID=2025608 RepID=UPI00261DAA7A|nr:type IV pilus twitching motility protein PilT [Sulfuricurvum sp.]MDD2829080.1 type IV pilus twitching motility protein PilT [Sulfuricurvum sp.]MDD4948828.1 type IV pilus twitching motility protein PilT [Sulfuricurvum sp.]